MIAQVRVTGAGGHLWAIEDLSANCGACGREQQQHTLRARGMQVNNPLFREASVFKDPPLAGLELVKTRG